jgi:ABC-type uncharacterized transport system permease subunit
VDNVLVMSPGYTAELTGSLSLHHSEMAIGNTSGLLAVGVCCNLTFLGSSGYWSASQYEEPGSDPGKTTWNFCRKVGTKTNFGTRTSVPVVNIISPMIHTYYFMQQ